MKESREKKTRRQRKTMNRNRKNREKRTRNRKRTRTRTIKQNSIYRENYKGGGKKQEQVYKLLANLLLEEEYKNIPSLSEIKSIELTVEGLTNLLRSMQPKDEVFEQKFKEEFKEEFGQVAVRKALKRIRGKSRKEILELFSQFLSEKLRKMGGKAKEVIKKLRKIINVSRRGKTFKRNYKRTSKRSSRRSSKSSTPLRSSQSGGEPSTIVVLLLSVAALAGAAATILLLFLLISTIKDFIRSFIGGDRNNPEPEVLERGDVFQDVRQIQRGIDTDRALFSLEGVQRDEVSGGDCTICLDSLNSDDDMDVVKTNCGHLYHKSCIERWINSDKTTCPTCRNDMSKPQRASAGLPGQTSSSSEAVRASSSSMRAQQESEPRFSSQRRANTPPPLRMRPPTMPPPSTSESMTTSSVGDQGTSTTPHHRRRGTSVSVDGPPNHPRSISSEAILNGTAPSLSEPRFRP